MRLFRPTKSDVGVSPDLINLMKRIRVWLHVVRMVKLSCGPIYPKRYGKKVFVLLQFETKLILEREKMMQKAADLQTMSNLVQTKQYGKALKMALRLGHPGQALSTITMLKGYGSHFCTRFKPKL